MAITKATVPSETSFVCNTKLFLEGSNNANLAKVLIRGARQLASGMSGIDGIDSIRQYLNNCDIEALITRIEESKNSLLRFDDSFAGEYFELLRQSINKLDENSSNGQYLREYGIYEKDYWNTLVAMLEKNEDNLNETLKEQLAIARAMAGYYNTSDEMGSRNTDSEKMVDLLEERKKCEAELLKLNKGLTEEDLAKALDSLEERYAVTILGVKYNSVQEKMSELNIDDEDYEDKCIDLLKEGTRYQKELLGLSKYLTKEEIKEQSALLDEECEKNVILVKNSIAGNQLSKLDITDEDYTIKCITLLAKQKEYAKEILKLDKSLTSEQLDEKINALESQYQYSCLLAENGKLQSDIDNLNIEAKDYEEKRLELLKGQRNCIEQMLKMNNNLTEEQISEQLTLLDQEIHSAKQNVEWAQTNAFEKFDQYTTAFVASAFCGVIDVGENIFDGLAMLAGKLSNDEETAAELVKTDFSEKVYAAWMSGGAGINDNAAYSKVHGAGNFVGNIGGYVLLSLVPGGAAVTSTLGFLAAEGSASERALNSGATFDQAFWVGAGSGVMGGIAGGWTSQFKTGLQDKIYSTIWEVVSDAAKGGAIGTVEPMVNAALEYSIYAKDLKDENGNLLYKNDLDYYLKSGTLVNVATGFASGFIGTGVSGAKKYYQYNREVNLLAKAMEAENENFYGATPQGNGVFKLNAGTSPFIQYMQLMGADSDLDYGVRTRIDIDKATIDDALATFNSAMTTGEPSNPYVVGTLYKVFKEEMENGNGDALIVIQKLTEMKQKNPEFNMIAITDNSHYSQSDKSLCLNAKQIQNSSARGTSMHELGHALFDIELKSQLPDNWEEIAANAQKYIISDGKFKSISHDLLSEYEGVYYQALDEIKPPGFNTIDELIDQLTIQNEQMLKKSPSEITNWLYKQGYDSEIIKQVLNGNCTARDIAKQTVKIAASEMSDTLYRTKYDSNAAISDIIDAVFEGDAQSQKYLWYGHGRNYYAVRKANAPFHEIIANFMQLKVTGSDKSLYELKFLLGDELYNVLEDTFAKMTLTD